MPFQLNITTHVFSIQNYHTWAGANFSRSSLRPRLLYTRRGAEGVNREEEEELSALAVFGFRDEEVSSTEVEVSLSAVSSLVSIHEL